jgi:hypothetical protein
MSKPHLPTVLPSGAMLMHMRARRRHEIMDTAFEMCGGVERLVHEMNKNSEGYWEGVKMWAKGAAKPVQIEHTFGESTEDMLDELERSENATVIGGNFTEPEAE